MKVSERPKGQSHHLQKLIEVDQFVIAQIVLDQPGIFLYEIQRHVLDQTGTDVSLSTLYKFLHKQGFRRQKIFRVAIQRSEELGAKFREEVSLFSPEMFVFIDETGSDRCECLRKFGYSVRGRPPRDCTVEGNMSQQ